MKQRNIFREIIFYVIIIVLIIVGLSVLFRNNRKKEERYYNDILTYFEKEQVGEVVISPKNILTLTLYEMDGDDYKLDGDDYKLDANGKKILSSSTVSYKLRDYAQFYEDLGDKIHDQVNAGIITKYEPQPANEQPVWLSYLPMILLILGIVILWIVSFRQLGGKNNKFTSFGRAKPKTANADDKDRVLFRDVAGVGTTIFRA